MISIYKYQVLAFIEDLTKRGRIWVGTLRDYQDTERHSHLRGDPKEGTLELTEKVFQITPTTDAPLTRAAFGYPYGTAPHRDTVIRNNQITLERQTENLWIYCTSLTLMSLANARRVIHPSYDAVAIIHDPRRFSNLLGDALNEQRPLREMFCSPITYRERVRPYAQDDGLDPALVKPRSHAEEAEYRLIYAPVFPIAEKGILLDVPELISCCRMLQGEEIPT